MFLKTICLSYLKVYIYAFKKARANIISRKFVNVAEAYAKAPRHPTSYISFQFLPLSSVDVRYKPQEVKYGNSILL